MATITKSLNLALTLVLSINIVRADDGLSKHFLGQNVRPNMIWVTEQFEYYADPQRANILEPCVQFVNSKLYDDSSVSTKICYKAKEFVAEVMKLSSDKPTVKFYIQRAHVERGSRQ